MPVKWRCHLKPLVLGEGNRNPKWAAPLSGFKLLQKKKIIYTFFFLLFYRTHSWTFNVFVSYHFQKWKQLTSSNRVLVFWFKNTIQNESSDTHTYIRTYMQSTWLQRTICKITWATSLGKLIPLYVMSGLMCIEESNMAIVLKYLPIHEKCFNSRDISKSHSCCLHINLPTSIERCHIVIGRVVWKEYNHLQDALQKQCIVCILVDRRCDWVNSLGIYRFTF